MSAWIYAFDGHLIAIHAVFFDKLPYNPVNKRIFLASDKANVI